MKKLLLSLALLMIVLPKTVNAMATSEANVLDLLAPEDEEADRAAAEAALAAEKARQAKNRNAQLTTKFNELEAARQEAIRISTAKTQELKAVQAKQAAVDERDLSWLKGQRTKKETQLADYTKDQKKAIADQEASLNAFTQARRDSITELDTKIRALELVIIQQKEKPTVPAVQA